MSYCKVAECRYPGSHVTYGHRCGKCGDFGHGMIECGNDEACAQLLQYASDVLPPNIRCSLAGCEHPQLHTSRAHHCKKCSQNHAVTTCPLIHAPQAVRDFHIVCPLCKASNTLPAKFQKMFGCDNECAVCLVNKVNVFLPQCGHICLCTDCLTKMNTNMTSGPEFKVYDEAELPPHIVREVKQQLFLRDGRVYAQKSGGFGCFWFLRRDFVGGRILGVFLHSDFQAQYGVDHCPLVKEFISGYEQVHVTAN